MPGYQSLAQRAIAQQPTQKYADGGIVHAIKGALGMRPRTPEELLAADAKRMEQNREAAAAIVERARQSQPAPQQQNAVSGYSGMSAMQRREKELGLKDGGRVEPRGFVSGKGTGTSDSIKARLSNGEYVLPADTVKAVGVQTLDALRAATHTPVKQEQEKAARGFFAGGTPGGVDEEKRKNSFGDAAAVSRDSSVTQVGGLANNGGADAARYATVPAPIGTQPGRTPVPATTPVASPAVAPAPAAASTDPANTPLGQMHSIGARSGGQMLADGARSGVQSFFDSFQKKPEPVAAPSTVAPVGVPDYKTDVQRGGGNVPAVDTPVIPATAPQTGTADATATTGTTGNVTKVGNSYSGTNVSGDITVNGQAPRNGGRISAENMAAADGLAARSQQASMARVAAQPAVGFQPVGVTAPVVQHSGNSWQARNDLRNLQVSASSIMNNGGPWDKHKGVSPERAAYEAAVATDQTLKGAQPGMDQEAMRQNAGIQREDMQQTGATTRTGMTEQGANSREAGRSALQRDEFNLRREASGFQTRAAQQQEQLRNVLLDPRATPEQRAVAQRNLAALSGKTAADRMQTVTLPDTTNEMGQVVRGGQALVRVLEDGSVQQVPIGARAPGQAPLPPGMTRQVGTSNGRPVYEDAKGNRFGG